MPVYGMLKYNKQRGEYDFLTMDELKEDKEMKEILSPFAMECLEIIAEGAVTSEEEYVEKRSADCVCTDYVFDSYGCMCRTRIQPGSP